MHCPPDIYLQQLSLHYSNRPLFIDLSLTIPAQRWVALLGPSGIGKTSLLRMLAGLNTQHAGAITTNNKVPLEQQIAYMAQTDLLLPWLTALQNALLYHTLHPLVKSHQQKLAAVETLFTTMNLATAKNHYPHQLSGGMRQRIALIRTLLADKSIVLMDEPFSAVDAITRYKLQDLAAHYLQNKTVIFITHDPMEALRLADDIYIMQGSPAKLTLAVSLATPRPRMIGDTELIKWQTTLFNLLSTDAII